MTLALAPATFYWATFSLRVFFSSFARRHDVLCPVPLLQFVAHSSFFVFSDTLRIASNLLNFRVINCSKTANVVFSFGSAKESSKSPRRSFDSFLERILVINGPQLSVSIPSAVRLYKTSCSLSTQPRRLCTFFVEISGKSSRMSISASLNFLQVSLTQHFPHAFVVSLRYREVGNQFQGLACEFTAQKCQLFHVIIVGPADDHRKCFVKRSKVPQIPVEFGDVD